MVRTLVLAIAAASCASAPLPEPRTVHAVVVAVEPGSYYVEKNMTARDLQTTQGVKLTLAPDGEARLTAFRRFAHWGDLMRLDDEDIEMRGRWIRRGQGIDIEVDVVRACLRGFGEPDCAHPPRVEPDDWRLRCRAMRPLPGSPLPGPALVCNFVGIEAPARYTVTLDGERVLVIGGPGRDSAIQYSYER